LEIYLWAGELIAYLGDEVVGNVTIKSWEPVVGGIVVGESPEAGVGKAVAF
jgi:hypothetical protein